MSDKTLTCRDCGLSFQFTESEQRFFAEKGFTNEPGRCPNCREARKANGGSRGGGYSSDGGSRGGGYSSGGGYRSEREMHPAVCAECGKDTQVPFQPRGDRPVYCSDCYQKRPAQSRGSSRY